MQSNYMGREKPPEYSEVPNILSANFVQSSRNASQFTSDFLHHDHTLPPLSFSLSLQGQILRSEQPTCPPTTTYTLHCQPSSSHLSPKSMQSQIDSSKTIVTDAPDKYSQTAGSVLSIEDADVRLAAEALEDLRAGSPHQQSRAVCTSPQKIHDSRTPQPKPLLSLLTTSHPFIGNAIGGSLSAYSASKNYCPRFKSSAEYMERQFTPVVNTVGSVGRITGVEEGVRWILGGRRTSRHAPSDPENVSQSSKKRRKLDEEAGVDLNPTRNECSTFRQDLHHPRRRLSQGSTVEGLPTCDEMHSSDCEAQQALMATKPQQNHPSPGSSWHSRLALSTSGLRFTMSEESLCSLKYCLGWLRWANERMGKAITALKEALDQYDNAKTTEGSGDKEEYTASQIEAERHALGVRIEELKKDMMKTLKEVVDIVSKYAGGALPDNSRALVRRHLTSLPQRFRIASSRLAGGMINYRNENSRISEGAHRILVLAKESLDMMAQVSYVLDGTIMSAENWCERLGCSRDVKESEFDDRGKPNKEPPHEQPDLKMNKHKEIVAA